MIKKEIFIGLIIGAVTNIIGIILITFIVSIIKESPFKETFIFYLDNGVLWMLIALGALPNLLVFFRLLNKNKEYRARGIVMATLIAAILAFLIYFGIL